MHGPLAGNRRCMAPWQGTGADSCPKGVAARLWQARCMAPWQGTKDAWPLGRGQALTDAPRASLHAFGRQDAWPLGREQKMHGPLAGDRRCIAPWQGTEDACPLGRGQAPTDALSASLHASGRASPLLHCCIPWLLPADVAYKGHHAACVPCLMGMCPCIIAKRLSREAARKSDVALLRTFVAQWVNSSGCLACRTKHAWKGRLPPSHDA
eukprot:1145203-Pelagomonas_calceolata.AAC.2